MTHMTLWSGILTYADFLRCGMAQCLGDRRPDRRNRYGK
jgi:hypothetical protein